MLIFRTDLRNLEVSACEFDAGSTPNPIACSCGSTVCAASSSCDASGSACDFHGGGCPPPPTPTCFESFPSVSSPHPCDTPACAGCPDSCADQAVCDSVVLAHCGTHVSDPGCSTTVELTCLENFPSGDPSASHHPCSSSWVGCPDSCVDQAGYDFALVSHCSLHESDLGCFSRVANVESACYSGCGDTLCATSTFPSGDPSSGSHPCNEPGCQGCPDSCANQASCDTAIVAHCALYGADLGCQPGSELCTTAVPE